MKIVSKRTPFVFVSRIGELGKLSFSIVVNFKIQRQLSSQNLKHG